MSQGLSFFQRMIIHAAKLFHEDYKKQKAPFWSVIVKIQGNNFFFLLFSFGGVLCEEGGWVKKWRVTEKPFSVLKSNYSIYCMYIVSPLF